MKTLKLCVLIMSILTLPVCRAAEESNIGAMDLRKPPLSSSLKEGVTIDNTAVTLNNPAGHWKGHWNAGQIKLPGNGRILLKAEVKNAAPAFTLQLYGGKVLPAPDKEHFENGVYEATWGLQNIGGQVLSAVWLNFAGKGPGAAVRIKELSVWRRHEKNALNADEILKVPPRHKAELKPHNGAMTLFVDDKPISGQMWSHICYHNVSDKYLNDVLNGLNYPLAAIPFAVGENRLTRLYPSSWLAEDEYDWSYIDTQAARVLKVRPDAKIILMLALDGAKWWTDEHPQEANPEVDNEKSPRYAGPKGIPDYLSSAWQEQQRKILRQLVAHVQSSNWGKSVIGYELFNGSSMDCNFMVPHTNRRVRDDFRNFLREKYRTDEALRKAWRDRQVTLDTAMPWTDGTPAGLILEPAKNQRFLDTRELIASQFRQVFSNVAAVIKEATRGRALVGARTGDFMGNYGWNEKWYKLGEDSGWLPPLLEDPNFDYFDVQEPYPGRQLGDGAGVPVIPSRGLLEYKKTIFIQNDVRTHLSSPNIGYGRTPDLPRTIQLQRRVFVNALTYNMIPYLWQMDYRYDQPELLAEYRRQEDILREAFARDRSSAAEVAIVLDPRMRLYLGSDNRQTDPSRYFSLFDFTKHVWQRGGAPFDMIFLDQIDKLPPYRVYIFYHTWHFSAVQQQMIQDRVFKDGRTAIFLWADGIIQEDGAFSAGMLARLTGLKLSLSPTADDWKMAATPQMAQLTGIPEKSEIGTLKSANYDACAVAAADWKYEPSIRIGESPGTIVLARRNDGSPGAVMRRTPTHTVIYSTSGNLTPPLMRLALKTSGAFQYTDATALLMMNASYIALHTAQGGTITLNFPDEETLTDLFSGTVYPAARSHAIPVREKQTYLFSRDRIRH